MAKRKVGAAPTVYDVAGSAGVSIATVSRAIRSPDSVTPATRERVEEAIQRLGYVPSASARALADRRTGAYGLLLPGFDDIEDAVEPVPSDGAVRITDDRGSRSPVGGAPLYFDEVLRGAEVEAWRHGSALLVAVRRGQRQDISGRVDGLAVFGRAMSEEAIGQVARRMPVVLIADEQAAPEIDSVSVDNARGMRAVVEHVVGVLGIRDLAYLAGPKDSPDDAVRRHGFAEALAAHGVDRRRLRMRHGDFGRARAAAVAAELLAERVPRALLCANDQSALGALDAIHAAGLRVPEDILVTGFDGIEAGGYASPPITTVRQPMRALGGAAIRALEARIADPTAPPQHLTLSVEVLLRESCPPTL
ncbi:LacI family DNA-binding transcriptional regulator [Gryllotalpicola koreensis]|uniref:LacI family DNA-binding transcriptional regulator n=1 Tax=Gryllotalpicola koreensis TaxID=993086 RepID=A0ABP8A0M0_9MICO